MGQAKNRGTLEQRAADAKAKLDSIKPAGIVCNECKADILEIQTMNTRGMPGIAGVFAGVCACGSTTYAMQGDKEAIADLMLAMESANASEAKITLQKLS
ncbi:hypothetical protein UNDKW_5953 (plasmid) [Undibacterium sp. KW1]|uniref:hypothetical protein n=1 Tax=Undibacterium sp. KW1 TaxID=2058624 RepID=UPI001331C55A|nr:hypothetical protein [Undibacterium sp. KW1]BBB64226.1 hypothetical protein UNDKW_5953 [Undibacterium sp. KW1]